MIHFNLACANEHEFEGWFQSGQAFDAQLKKKQVICPICEDTKIGKAPMAPAVASGSSSDVRRGGPADAAVTREMLTKLRHHVEQSCENVGDKFAEEARKIHYGETESRGIYGETTNDEAQDLSEEGVPFARLPWPKKTDS